MSVAKVGLAVYEFAVLDGYEWVLPILDADFRTINELDGSSRRQDWKPIPVRLLKKSEDGRPLQRSDFPWLGKHAPVLRSGAAGLLGPALQGVAELLPLTCDEEQLFLVNVLQVVDALDQTQTQFRRYAHSGRIMFAERYAFDPERLTAARYVFKVPELLSGGPVFADATFFDLVSRVGLRGVGFKLLWQG